MTSLGQLLSARRARPAVPSVHIPAITPARVPSPPLLLLDGVPEEEAPRLARQFAMATYCEMRRPSPAGDLRSAPRRWSRWALVSAAIDDLRARGVPPAAYIRYALRMWRDFMRRREVPALSWAFAPGMTDKHAERAAEQATDMGGAVVITPAYAELSRLRAELSRGRSVDPLVARRLAGQAMYEAERERERLEREVREGWPW